MGNFRGHAFPGTMMLILGVFHFLRALDVSFLRRLRTSQFFITFESWGFAFYGALGASLEWLDNAIVDQSPFSISESHLDHIHITGAISMAGLITLLHQYKVLKGAGWGLALPAGLIFIATYFNAHPQHEALFTFSHEFTAFLFYLYGFSRIMEYLVNLHANKSHRNKVKQATSNWMTKGKTFSKSYYFLGFPDLLCPLLCCKKPRDKAREEEETLVGLHYAYTNQAVYGTVFPLVTAFALFFNAVWWWEMAVSLFLNKDHISPGDLDGHHSKHYAYSHMIYPHLVWTIFFFVFTGLILQWIDRRWYKQEKDKKDEEEESSGLVIELEEDLPLAQRVTLEAQHL